MMMHFQLPARDSSGRRRAISAGFAAATSVFLLTHVALAAPAAGTIEGIAKDEQGRPVGGAQIRVQTPDGKIVSQGRSGPEGGYRFTGLAPGTYHVLVEKGGFEIATATVTLSAQVGGTADVTLAAPPAVPIAPQAPEEITVTAKRLEEARLGIQPQIGASTYTLSRESIEQIPGADNIPINDVLLRAPGVTQDNLGNGAVHVRNEHLGIQYRINGIVLPEGVSFFSQALSPRFVDSLQLITGALPAQYGLRTSGIVDIRTRNGFLDQGGAVSVYGGSFNTIHPAAEYGGHAGTYSYFVSGDFFHTDVGVDPVTPAYHQIHDTSDQLRAFAYLEKIIDSRSRVNLIAGVFNGQFQIPNNPGQTPALATLNGVPTTNFDSARLNQNQVESNQFAVASYLRAEQDLSFQISAFTKYSTAHYYPDFFGDLVFNGISQNVLRTSFASGIQSDGSYKLFADHTLRAGWLITGERVSADTNSLVTGANDDVPFFIPANTAKTGWAYSAYLQDEWRVTPTVTVNYGGRFDVVDQFVHGNQLSPRINVVWQASPSTVFHAGYANYFSPPSFELVSPSTAFLFVNTSGATPSTASSPVKAERAHYFDVGVTQDVLPGLKVGLDAYYKYSRNLVDEGQFGAPLLLTPFNYHIGINQGIELTTNYQNGPFTYYGNLAIGKQKASGINSSQFNFSQDDLDLIATHFINTDHTQVMTASAGVSYLWGSTRFSADIIAGTGLRTTRAGGPPNGGSVPSYEQLNLGVSHVFTSAPGGPVTVRLDLINVLDEIYLLRSQTGIGEFANQFGPRRSVFAGVSKQF